MRKTLAAVCIALGICSSCSKREAELHRRGVRFSEEVYVDYIQDKNQPGSSVVIVNPFSKEVKGLRDGGINNLVFTSRWTVEPGGTKYGWQVNLSDNPAWFRMGKVKGGFEAGRFLILTDPHAQEAPKQLNVQIPDDMADTAQFRGWLESLEAMKDILNTATDEQTISTDEE